MGGRLSARARAFWRILCYSVLLYFTCRRCMSLKNPILLQVKKFLARAELSLRSRGWLLASRSLLLPLHSLGSVSLPIRLMLDQPGRAQPCNLPFLQRTTLFETRSYSSTVNTAASVP